MGSQQIEALLEKYWACETNREEERILKDFFTKGESSIPGHLRPYAVYFTALRQRKDMRMPQREEAAKKTFAVRYLSPAFKIAAVGLILLAVGLSIDTHYKNEKILTQSSYSSETLTDPQQAMEEVNQAFNKISISLAKAQAALTELADTSQVNPE